MGGGRLSGAERVSQTRCVIESEASVTSPSWMTPSEALRPQVGVKSIAFR